MRIRAIEQKDNQQMGALIQQVLIEHEVPKKGTAYSDPFLFSLYDYYKDLDQAKYFVIVDENENVLGGCGYGPILNSEAHICEIQKMYFYPQTRGKGMGALMMKRVLEEAKNDAYSLCYIETMPQMQTAQRLYKNFGFEYIDEPIGETGHPSCSVFMTLNL
tara:strand:+ start:7235 stop:7717 length:483 start_codon:yes stop_codon:yes gene_type:complete